MDILWKICGILGPILISVLSAVMVWQRRRAERLKLESEQTGIEDAARDVGALRELLQPVLFALCTQAEREFGGGTGRLKLADVLSRVVALLPDWAKTVFTTDELCGFIETALQKAKAIWKESPALTGDIVTNAVGLDVAQ
jgi:hypothetical protein